MKKSLILLLLSLLPLLPAAAQDALRSQKKPTAKAGDSIPARKVETERLPDMNVARLRHTTLFVNGELTVIGGHTNGFVPTATAEYFSDGAWHELPTVYSHDDGEAVVMKSGRVLLAGGHEQSLGIGQTYTAEWYDPVTHTFDGFGCMDVKRVMACAVEMDSGQVVISGNWYHQDGIEQYNGDPQFVAVKDVAQQRCFPYIFRTSHDNAVIFSALDTVGHVHDSVIVDRLHGEPVTPALFREWRPVHIGCSFRPANSFIGDEAQGLYAHLFTVCNKDGQVAIALLQGEEFSLLPTVGQVPMAHDGHPIGWLMPVVADRQAKRAYLMGASTDDTHIIYILGIDYGQSPAVLTLYLNRAVGVPFFRVL